MLKNVLYVAPCEREEFVSRVNGDESRPLRAVKVGASDDDDEDHDDAMMRDFSIYIQKVICRKVTRKQKENFPWEESCGEPCMNGRTLQENGFKFSSIIIPFRDGRNR